MPGIPGMPSGPAGSQTWQQIPVAAGRTSTTYPIPVQSPRPAPGQTSTPAKTRLGPRRAHHPGGQACLATAIAEIIHETGRILGWW